MLRLVIATAVISSGVGFQQPHRTNIGRLGNLGQRNAAQLTTLKMAVVASPSTSTNIVQKFMAASLKKKMVFLAHPVAVVALALLLKSVIQALLPIILAAIVRMQDALGLKTAKRFGVDNSGKRFYGIAKPMKKPTAAVLFAMPAQKPKVPVVSRPTLAQTPIKKVAVAGAVPSASIAQAKARVVSILAALDEASIKVKSKSMVSFNSIMRLDAEKAGRDAYLAKIKLQEKERSAKLAKAQAQEMAAVAVQERATKIAAKEAEARKKSEEVLAMKRQQEEEKKAQMQAEALDRKRREEEAYILAAQKTQATEKKQEVTFSVKSTKNSDWSPHSMMASRV